MHILHFFTSKRGAIKPLNALLISAAVGGVFAYTVGTVSDQQLDAERRVRTLSSVQGTSPRQGMLRRDGQLTSINVGDGRNQLATAEERAAMQGNRALDRYMANQQALGDMDAALGRAAQFSESDGLNTGNREVTQIAPQLVQGSSVDTGEGVAGAINRGGTYVAAGENASGGNATSLAPASITRASGSNSGSSSGAVSGGIVGGPGNPRGGSAEGVRMSGAMPGGSNIMSQRGLDKGPLGNSGTSFGAGYRDGRLVRGPKAGQGKNELDDIAKRSARAATSASPSANEGAQAFLAGATRAGGIVVEGASEEGGSSSQDLSAPTSHKLKAIGNHLQKVENKLEDRQTAQRKLTRRLLLTLAISLGMMAAGMAILNRFPHKNLWYYLIAAALMSVVVTANAVMMNAAHHFIRDYGRGGGIGLAWLSIVLGPVMVAGMTYVILQPFNAWNAIRTLGKNIWKGITKGFNVVDIAMGSLKNTILGAIFK